MTSLTQASASIHAKASDSTSSDRLSFAPSHQERRGEGGPTATTAASSEAATDAMTRPRRLHPYRRSPRFACHFDGLAADEVQSIMQMLDQSSLLRFARCSRRMHADADLDVAWQSQPIYPIHLPHSPIDIGTRIEQSLLRHLPQVTVGIIRRKTDPPVDVQTVLAIPRITHIWGWEFGLDADEWLRILSHPCTAGLTTLTISDPSLLGALPAELMAQLTRLTRLESIGIERPLSRGDLLSVLPTLPALTSLNFCDLSGSVNFVFLLPPALHACPRLTHLTLGQPSDDSRLFRRLFCDVGSPSVAAFLSRLEYLELELFESIVSTIPASDLGETFAAMTGLRHLSLDSVERIDDLLPFVALLVGLTDLDIRSYDSGYDVFDELDDEEYTSPTTTPTVGALQAMMQVSSAHITLYVYDCYESLPDPRYAFDRLDPTRFTLDRDHISHG